MSNRSDYMVSIPLGEFELLEKKATAAKDIHEKLKIMSVFAYTLHYEGMEKAMLKIKGSGYVVSQESGYFILLEDEIATKKKIN